MIPITNLQDNDGDLIFDLDLGTSTIIDKTEKIKLTTIKILNYHWIEI